MYQCAYQVANGLHEGGNKRGVRSVCGDADDVSVEEDVGNAWKLGKFGREGVCVVVLQAFNADGIARERGGSQNAPIMHVR